MPQNTRPVSCVKTCSVKWSPRPTNPVLNLVSFFKPNAFDTLQHNDSIWCILRFVHLCMRTCRWWFPQSKFTKLICNIINSEHHTFDSLLVLTMLTMGAERRNFHIPVIVSSWKRAKKSTSSFNFYRKTREGSELVSSWKEPTCSLNSLDGWGKG